MSECILDLRERNSIVATRFCSQHILDAFRYSSAELTVGQNGGRQNGIGRRQAGSNDQGSGDVYLEQQSSEQSADEPAEGHDDCWNGVSRVLLSGCMFEE